MHQISWNKVIICDKFKEGVLRRPSGMDKGKDGNIFVADRSNNVIQILDKIKQFADARNWDKYHNPKNLSMALSGEVGELLEIFQWLNSEESSNLSNEDFAAAKEEIADIMIYLIRLADKLDINLEEAVNEKLKLNESKYPVELSKDNAVKYNKR